MEMDSYRLNWLIFVTLALSAVPCSVGKKYISALGDPGMARDGLRVAFEGWNFCNEVGAEAPNMGSPRAADCFDIYPVGDGHKIKHRVTEEDNKLSVGEPFVGGTPSVLTDVDLYAVEKELYLASKCQVDEADQKPWHFWMVMLKNGNMDTLSGLCPKDGHKVGPFPPEPRFPCFGKGCMNQPLLFHEYTSLQEDNTTMKGSFYGTYDLDADLSKGFDNISYSNVTWKKEVGKGSWVFHHVLKTSEKYPWLMLYLRSDATTGLSGGYNHQTRGMTRIIPESPDFTVRFTLNVMRGGGPKSQFYLMDMGSCWKNNGQPCDGDVTTDVTRYSEMIINPSVTAWCRADNLNSCPPYHTLPNGTRIHRTATANYPYGAYHMYCTPGNAQHPEEPYNICDQYSNPQPQEILQIIPHPAWGDYGYPTEPGQGWIGDPRTWELDVGRMSQALYFYQDPGTPPVRRLWPSLDVGTEIYVSKEGEIAEWELSNFEVVIPDPSQ
ncbi:hypothetical protein CKAN_01809400 [Cinnamomum micranthum f. kanehirae]|uniref:DUF7705 domain-containing protein n=1 Tax=Cinnamomum micranthum f. kanehirae TaxID=337451 RepID=A0A3S3QQV8_9MAGN|nr:hypothetical protein CKAN_01809400 [Cinnamomum micranthum f. kanehirae]